MSIKFDIHGPAAKQLVGLTFAKIKEVWDPSLNDDAVAQYAVALVAKGSDRKKLTNTLSAILGEEATSDLLDWILRYVKLHKQELTSSKGPAPAKKKAATEAKAAHDTVKAAPAPAAPQPAADPDDIEALINEDVDDVLDDERQDGGDDELLEGEGDAYEPAAPAAQQDRDSGHRHAEADHYGQAGQSSDRRKRERSPEQQDGRRARPKSAIQWAPPSGAAATADTGRRHQDGTAPPATADAAELQARRQRFGMSAQGEDARGGHEADGGRGRQGGVRDRERDGPSSDRHRSLRSRSRSRSGSPPHRDGPRGPSREGGSFRDQRGGREWDRHKEWVRPGPGRRDLDRPGHSDGGGWGGERWRRGMEGPDARFGRFREDGEGGWGDRMRDRDVPRGRSPDPAAEPIPSPRPRLKSAVSGSLPDVLPAEAEAEIDPKKQAVVGASRMLGLQLMSVLGEKLLSERKRGPLVVKRKDVEAAEAKVAAAAAAAEAGGRSVSPEAEVKEPRKGVFERLGISKPPAQLPAQGGASGSVHEAQPPAAQAPVSSAPPSQIRQAVPIQETAAGPEARASAPQQQPPVLAPHMAPVAQQMMQQQMMMQQQHAGAQAQMMMMPGMHAGRAQPVAWSSGMDQFQQGFQSGVRGPGFSGNTVPFLHDMPPIPVKPAVAPPVPTKPSATALAALKLAQQQQPAPTKPSATAVATATLKPSATALPGGGVKSGVGAAPAAGAASESASDEMAKILAALKAKELEINRIKGQLAIQTVMKPVQQQQKSTGPQAAPVRHHADSDARSVVVQNLPAAASEDLLRTHFSVCGAVSRVTVLRDKMTGRPLGQAYVEFVSPDVRSKALSQMSGSQLLDQQIRVVPKAGRPSATAVAAAAGLGEAGKRLGDTGPLKTGSNVWRRPVKEGSAGGQEGAPAAAPA